MSKQSEEKAKPIIRIVSAVIILTTLLIILFASCTGPEKIKNKGYLVAVETSKPRHFNVHKLRSEAYVDTLVLNHFGFAIGKFNSDTIFDYSPYFKIETINKTIYAEEKELVKKNGKIKLKKIK